MTVTYMDKAARAAIGAAYAAARHERRAVIGDDHLLEALTATPRGLFLLAPVTADLVREELMSAVVRSHRDGGFTAAERNALADLGIDLEDVRTRADASLGEGALDDRHVRPSDGWSQRMTDLVACVLARAEDFAIDEGVRAVGIDHLTLALVDTPGVVSEQLGARGVTSDSVRARRMLGERNGNR